VVDEEFVYFGQKQTMMLGIASMCYIKIVDVEGAEVWLLLEQTPIFALDNISSV
jgi:hypothetical protein